MLGQYYVSDEYMEGFHVDAFSFSIVYPLETCLKNLTNI